MSNDLYNPDKYRHALQDQLKRWMEARKNDGKDLAHSITMFSISTHCPIIVACKLVEEIYGPSEELTNQIVRLEKFYKVKE